MKILYTFLLSACSIAVVAQTKTNKSRVSQRVSDDGKTMHITVTGDVDGRTVNYDRTFNVANLSQAEKTALKNRIADSLGTSRNGVVVSAQSAVGVPAAPVVPNVAGRSAVSAHVGGKGSKTTDLRTSVNDNNGTMHLQITGYQAQKPIKYDRKFDVKGLSAAQKNAIVQHVTDSLGVSNNTSVTTGK
jgi:hypothetical protein